MDDVTKERLAGLKRKKAAMEEAGQMDRASELDGAIANLLAAEEAELPASPRAIPSPVEASPKVEESPKTAQSRPLTKRGSASPTSAKK